MCIVLLQPQKDQSEHSFKKAPGNFTWDVIPGASGPYINAYLARVVYFSYQTKFKYQTMMTQHVSSGLTRALAENRNYHKIKPILVMAKSLTPVIWSLKRKEKLNLFLNKSFKP